MSNRISSFIGSFILNYAFKFKIKNIDNEIKADLPEDSNLYMIKFYLYKELYLLGCDFFRE